ncbi:hypothetical protein KGQ71_05060 [Patescibacteria group bacterium]|nr:hypothetical protein [Patescibacteria group bacterium]
MKRWVVRFRAVDKKNFDALRDGVKSVETRAATEKYRKIRPGDTLVVLCGIEKTEKLVASVDLYPSIEALFAAVPLEQVMPTVKTVEEARKEYYGYRGYREEIARYGLVAMKLIPIYGD